MHITEDQYLNRVNSHIKTIKYMHDLKTNFLKMLGITNTILANKLDVDGNLHFYPRKPKLSDSRIIALSLCQECLGIDSENWFISKLKSDYKEYFRDLIHITNYNKRRKRLSEWTEQVNCSIAAILNEGEDVYMIDSIPVPVCKLAREHQLRACRHDFETAPDKGYSAVHKQYYIGYKLHLTIGINGVYQNMEITKASVHDVHYLNEVKHSGSVLVYCWAIKAIYHRNGNWTCLPVPTSNWKHLKGLIRKTSNPGHLFSNLPAEESKLSLRNFAIK